MVATLIKKSPSFAEFLDYDFPEEGRYELVNGEIMRIQPTKRHDDIADFMIRQFDKEVERLNLNYRVSGRIVQRTFNRKGKEQGRFPDISVVDKTKWEANPNTQSVWYEPLQLIVEIASHNWEDDYIDKLEEYQSLGVSEYWIIDHLALGSRDYLGNPKLPSILIYLLDENNIYQQNIYQNDQQINSRTFPELKLTMSQILTA